MAWTREDAERLVRSNVSEQELSDELTKHVAGSGYQTTSQDIYNWRIRPQEEARLAAEIARVRASYGAALGAAAGRNVDLAARLGLSGSAGARFGSAISAPQGRSLGDLFAERAARFERELDNPARFALIDRVQRAAASKSEGLQTLGSALMQSGNAVGTAMLGYLPGGTVWGPAVGAAAGVGFGALSAGLGAKAAEKLGSLAPGAVTNVFRPAQSLPTVGPGGFTPQPRGAAGGPRYFGDEEEDWRHA